MTTHAVRTAMGDRWAAELRLTYPGDHAAKRIARTFDVGVRTAEGWLTGRPPGVTHLMTACALHGAGFIASVLLPRPPNSEHQVRRIKQEGAALADRLRQLGETSR